MMIENSKNVNTAPVETQGGDFKIGDNFYKSLEYKELQQKIKDLQKLMSLSDDIGERLEYSQRLNETEKILAGFVAEVKNLYESFTKTPLNTERLRLAKSHFEAGEYREARAILNAKEIAQEVKALKTEEKDLLTKTTQNKQHLIDKANEYLILAQLTVIDYNNPNRFEETKQHFENSLKAAEFYENVFEYATFLQEHIEIGTSIIEYKKALNITQNDEQKADSLHCLGKVYGINNDLDKSFEFFKDALIIREKIAKINPKYLLKVADTLNNLAVLHLKKYEFEDGLTTLKNVLKIRQESIPISLHSIAITLSNIATAYMSKRDYNESEQYFNESLEIYKILTRNESNFYLSDLANILNTASELFRLQNKFKQAVDFQNDSLNIYLKLSDKNPQKYLEFMASGYNNLAASYSQSNHSELAEQLWIKSLCIYRNLAKINLKAFLPLVAVSAVNLARYYTDGNTPDRSRALIFAVESYQSSLPFVNTLPDSKRDQNDALKIFAAWGEDVDAYLKNHNQATA
jgi:hypothetical protein